MGVGKDEMQHYLRVGMLDVNVGLSNDQTKHRKRLSLSNQVQTTKTKPTPPPPEQQRQQPPATTTTTTHHHEPNGSVLSWMASCGRGGADIILGTRIRK